MLSGRVFPKPTGTGVNIITAHTSGLTNKAFGMRTQVYGKVGGGSASVHIFW